MDKELRVPEIIGKFMAELADTPEADKNTEDFAASVLRRWHKEVTEIAEEFNGPDVGKLVDRFTVMLLLCFWRAGAVSGFLVGKGRVADINDNLPTVILDGIRIDAADVTPKDAEFFDPFGLGLGDKVLAELQSFDAWAERHARMFGGKWSD